MVRDNKKPHHYKNIIRSLSKKLVKECEKLIEINEDLNNFYSQTSKPFDTKSKKDETRLNNKRKDCISIIKDMSGEQSNFIENLVNLIK